MLDRIIVRKPLICEEREFYLAPGVGCMLNKVKITDPLFVFLWEEFLKDTGCLDGNIRLFRKMGEKYEELKQSQIG